MSNTNAANSPSHYMLITLAVVIGLAGVYVRFIGDQTTNTTSIIGNVLMVLGTIVALKAVFGILKG